MHKLIAQLTPGSMWKHFRSGTIITVLHVGRVEKTQELCVIYCHGPGTNVWVRPLDEWFNLIDVSSQTRFELVQP